MQSRFAEHGRGVVRIAGTIHERIAVMDARLDVDVDLLEDGVFTLLSIVADDVDLAYALGDFAVFDNTVDLRDDGFARLAGTNSSTTDHR